ncbi:hypothetical protein ACTS94_02600 [Empedobacter falsenii]
MGKEANLEKIIESIQSDGSKTFRLIRLTQLLHKEKAKNISEQATRKIYDLLKSKKIFVAPTLDETLSTHHRNERVTLTLKQVRRSRLFFDTEKELEDFITDKNILQTELKVNKEINRQTKIIGAKDKVDFIAVKKGKTYLIEIKHKTSYYGIEQLLRYKGISKDDNSKLVLITGIEDPKLHHTFKGMHKEQRKMFTWYVYDWDGKKDIEFNKIKI